MLRVLTVATDPVEKDELRLLAESKGQVTVVLAETPYYESLENAMKIRKYVKQRNVAQLPKSMQDIIRAQQDEAGKYELTAADELKKAISSAQFYVDGEHIDIKNGDAKNKIDQALECLVVRVYSELGLITKLAETDADIIAVLRGNPDVLPNFAPNQNAAAKVENFLEMQYYQNLPTTMSDIQERFQKKPYGWREIDIAAVVAMLIYDQKVTIKYGGTTIQSSDPKLPDMLRKKSEIGKTSIAKREVVSKQKIRTVKEFLREFFDEMDVPEDEDGLIKHIRERFNNELEHYDTLNIRYIGHKYPDQNKVKQAIALVKDVLSQQNDNTALIQSVIDHEDALFDMRDALQEVEEFFKNRVALFDSAVTYAKELDVDQDYIQRNEAANQALIQIKQITMIPDGGKFRYDRIPELNVLMDTLRTAHGAMLDTKRDELQEIVRQCMKEIHNLAGDNSAARNVSNVADSFFTQKKQQIDSYQTLALLDSLVQQLWQYKDEAVNRIEDILNPPAKTPKTESACVSQATKKIIKPIPRQMLFPAKTLHTDEEIDSYLDAIRVQLKELLKGCDGVKVQ